MTPTTTMMRTTCAQGVVLLQRGNTKAARESFRHSANGLVSAMEENQQPHQQDDDLDMTEKMMADPWSGQCIPLLPAYINVEGCVAEYLGSPDSSFVFYNKCFVVLTNSGEQQHSSLWDKPHQGVIAAAVVFNIGLTYHVDFLRSGNMKSLGAAAGCYRKALYLFQSSASTSHCTFLDEELESMECALLLAIYNNFGHCCAHAFDSLAVNVIRNHVKTLLEEYWTEGTEDAATQQEFYFFQEQIQLYVDGDIILATSPAA